MKKNNPGSALAKIRWKKATKKDKDAHIAMMNKARKDKKLIHSALLRKNDNLL